MVFLKKDLAGTQYTWADAADEHRYAGAPSRRLFDKFNGNQVLLILNFLSGVIGTLGPGDGRQLETMLLEQLPVGAKSELSAFNWLWKSYINI